RKVLAAAVEAAAAKAALGIEVAAQRGPEAAAAIASVMPAAVRPELTVAAIVAPVEGAVQPGAIIEDVAVIERQIVIVVRAAIIGIAIAVGRIVAIGIGIGLIVGIRIAISGLRVIRRRAIGRIAVIAFIVRLRARRAGQRAQRTEGDDGCFEGVSHLRFAPGPPPRED